MADYLADRTVLIKMSCQPEVRAGPDVDIGLIPVEQRVSWGTGVLIRKDGYVVTTHHTLAELFEESEEQTFRTVRYTTACDPDQVRIGFFRTNDLPKAASGGDPTFPEDSSAPRDDTRAAAADVLFVKANTFGDDDLPFICKHELYQSDTAFENLPIHVRQIEIQKEGQFSLRFRDGLASSEHGRGRAANFLVMDIPAQPGASGAAVVDESGRIVGLVHGYSEMSNPEGNDNYLIPYRLFDDVLKDYADPCEEESPSDRDVAAEENWNASRDPDQVRKIESRISANCRQIEAWPYESPDDEIVQELEYIARRYGSVLQVRVLSSLKRCLGAAYLVRSPIPDSIRQALPFFNESLALDPSQDVLSENVAFLENVLRIRSADGVTMFTNILEIILGGPDLDIPGLAKQYFDQAAGLIPKEN
ncbi:trypsin-like peptidase domain-containing protein [Paracoccus sp. MC1854]|nr:trypsin-like peptidase domain-containing protein [Paracoccus sp. MC1854]